MGSFGPPGLNILITGGSSGIGEAIAMEMQRAGGVNCHSFFLIGRDEEKLKKVCLKFISPVAYGVGDVSSEADVKRIYKEAQNFFTDENGEHEPIDVVVLNAGVGRFGECEDLTVADFDLTFNTNVRGVFLWLQQCLPSMKERGKGGPLFFFVSMGRGN